MNFLAHLWLTDRAALPLAGAVLGDVLHGALPAAMPPALARSVQFHRVVDAHTDRHPRVLRVRAGFAQGARRFAGIVLDVAFDHVLASEWAAFSSEPLAQFADRAGRAMRDDAAWFAHAGEPAPDAARFSALLQSYATAAGIERAIRRTASRLRVPEGLLHAAADWHQHLPQLRADLPVVLADLEQVWAHPDTSSGAQRPDQGLM
jgi:acyl carrier protein phosphodiesterase